jgi:hypothetical protein
MRKTGIRILVHPLPYGSYTAEPIAKHWQGAFQEYMTQWQQGSGLYQAFFQGDWDLPDTVKENRQYSELVKGWDITILVDPWEFGHWLGWDAHTVAERS